MEYHGFGTSIVFQSNWRFLTILQFIFEYLTDLILFDVIRIIMYILNNINNLVFKTTEEFT